MHQAGNKTLSMKISHYLVTGGEEMKKGYAKHYNLDLEKIKVVPNRINLNRFVPKKKKRLFFALIKIMP